GVCFSETTVLVTRNDQRDKGAHEMLVAEFPIDEGIKARIPASDDFDRWWPGKRDVRLNIEEPTVTLQGMTGDLIPLAANPSTVYSLNNLFSEIDELYRREVEPGGHSLDCLADLLRLLLKSEQFCRRLLNFSHPIENQPRPCCKRAIFRQ